MRKTGRTARKIENGRIAKELRKLRKVMVVLKKLAEMERREGVGQKSAGIEVRMEREGGKEEDGRIKEERRE